MVPTLITSIWFSPHTKSKTLLANCRLTCDCRVCHRITGLKISLFTHAQGTCTRLHTGYFSTTRHSSIFVWGYRNALTTEIALRNNYSVDRRLRRGRANISASCALSKAKIFWEVSNACRHVKADVRDGLQFALLEHNAYDKWVRLTCPKSYIKVEVALSLFGHTARRAHVHSANGRFRCN